MSNLLIISSIIPCITIFVPVAISFMITLLFRYWDKKNIVNGLSKLIKNGKILCPHCQTTLVSKDSKQIQRKLNKTDKALKNLEKAFKNFGK